MAEVSTGFRTRGQPSALAALRSMLTRGVPHAILLVGPPGVGKTTLADDLAAALLCLVPEPADRPCRRCRSCRAMEHANHPDLHRLEPGGTGGVIPIGGREERGIRDLVRELALLPVEGGARVAVISAADRMSDDAQSALLKTLEEPPSGAVLILCADDEERLLPTIRSRCARLRLGPVPIREVERLLAELGLAEPPVAGRLARLAGGRPGVAVRLSGAPEVLAVRAEISRTLLDLAPKPRTDRLRVVRDLATRAVDLGGGPSPRPRGKVRSGAPLVDAETATAPLDGDSLEPAAAAGSPGRLPAAERRGAAIALVGVWRDLARDLLLVGLGEPAGVRELDLLDDLADASTRLRPAFAVDQLRRLELAGERLEGNVSPELVLDALAIGWAA